MRLVLAFLVAFPAFAGDPPFLSIKPAQDGGKDVLVGMKRGDREECCLEPRDEGGALVVDLRSNETTAPPPDPECDHPVGRRPQYCVERQGGLAHAHRAGVYTVHLPRGRALKIVTWQHEVTLGATGKVTRRKSHRPPLPPPAMD